MQDVINLLKKIETNEEYEQAKDKLDYRSIVFVEKNGNIHYRGNAVYEFVDLGLPSGLKWATCNVGAEKPYEYGLYFQVGDSDGYDGVIYKRFGWEDYKWSNTGSGAASDMLKYNATDGLTVLEKEDDAAYMTDSWCRMPTSGEAQELIDNTTTAWTTDYNGSGVKRNDIQVKSG